MQDSITLEFESGVFEHRAYSLALGVDNVDQAYAEVINDGCTPFSSPTRYELTLFGGILVSTAFVVDRNGVYCEFIDEDWSDRIIAYAKQFAPEQQV
jgi:hypothetical protein